jgi:hypothetical protein
VVLGSATTINLRAMAIPRARRQMSSSVGP